MTDDLRKRLAAFSDGCCPGLYEIALEAIERLETTRKAVGLERAGCADSPGFDACEDAVLDCEGVESGGKGKVDIRKYFARKG